MAGNRPAGRGGNRYDSDGVFDAIRDADADNYNDNDDGERMADAGMEGLTMKRLAGGLLGIGKTKPKRLSLPLGWTRPDWVDSRPYCLDYSDQGATSQCAAYSMAGLIEVHNWKRTHIAIQIDPDPIYREAKRIDGDNDDGTYATSVFQAAINLKLIPESSTATEINGLEDLQFAIHRDGVCLLGCEISEQGWQLTDSAGWIAQGRKTPGAGHMTLACWYKRGSGIGWQNSWINWGFHGFGRMTEEQFADQFMCGLAVQIH